MSKNLLFLLVTLCICTSCIQKPRRNASFDAGVDRVVTLYCNVDDRIIPAEDFNNCTQLGESCSVNKNDRCCNMTCQCGNNSACQDEDRCISGRCIRPDKFSRCEAQRDCINESGGQECIVDAITLEGHCIDVCEFSTECANGFVCVGGACTRFECVSEICDGVDNDCDEFVDENADNTGVLSEWCYPGGNSTVVPSPPCRRGNKICTTGGVWSECSGAIVPKIESGLLSCNLLDDDCDGCVDGQINDEGNCSGIISNGFDILYLIDISGSMDSANSAVFDATSRFASQYAGSPEFRFGLVVISGYGAMDKRAYVDMDFTDFETFNIGLSGTLLRGGSVEPTWDAVYESAIGEIAYSVDTNMDGEKDAIDDSMTGLSWREGSIRIMIMFGDETAQSTRLNFGKSQVDESIMCSSLTHGETLVVFGKEINREQFDDCGTWYPISTDASEMVVSLQNVIVDPCL